VGLVLDRLMRLGLTSYEAKTYLALIKRDSFTAAQVARQAEVPRQRIYDVLGSLVEKGLASTKPGRAVKYSATAPDLAIPRLVADHRTRLEAMEADAELMVAEMAKEYAAGQRETDPLDYIEVLRDRRAINERFAQLQRQIQHEILVFTKAPYATPPQDNLEGLEVLRTHEARSMYELSLFDDPDATAGVKMFIDQGEGARFLPELPLKLVIIDENIVMFGMEDPVAGSDDLTIVVVEHPSLARILKVAFESCWSQGMTFDEARAHVLREQRKTA
jgi:HTH-type transcriptional regulator, sugar sensing transcriptional regulator